MLGLFVQGVLSWLILKWYKQTPLSVLGWQPTGRRLAEFAGYMLLTAACCASGFILRMGLGNEVWELNPGLTVQQSLNTLWWNIKSVLFEELIFRGALFYVLIQVLGSRNALLVSSAAFGVYHWFSQEVFGNPVQMLILFVMTGGMGLVYAYGFIKTGALYVPAAMHLGWNLTQGFVFSQGVTGTGVFLPAAVQTPVTVSYATYGVIVFTPILSAWLLNVWFLKNRKEEGLRA